ncbi:MAG: dinitrogenase iron-molybdenum cofactor biosynthesis protein [Campylobacteraceae bacterium]|jgi:nitrogen fixation protein NifX|nr:dinitrogenase iron-molybdenum cofactor biosynthesis protein [Campylobacteraceae bacterium]
MIKVAFLTNDLKNIDAHFGSAEYFALYDVSGSGHTLFGVVNVDAQTSDSRVELLQKECVDILYCTDIGAAAAAKVVNGKIFPIKYKDSVSIELELEKLSNMLLTNPPPFIKKIEEERA